MSYKIGDRVTWARKYGDKPLTVRCKDDLPGHYVVSADDSDLAHTVREDELAPYRQPVSPYTSDTVRDYLMDCRAQHKQAYLIGADLREADLRNLEIGGVDFSYADLRGVVFDGADIRDGNFHRANLTRASFKNCTLRQCDFTSAELPQVNFRGSHLVSVKFYTARVTACTFIECRLEKVSFKHTNLAGSWLTDVDLSTVYLMDAKIDGCDLSGTTGLRDVNQWLAQYAPNNIVYRTPSWYSKAHKASERWSWEAGAILSEVCDPNPTRQLGAGVHFFSDLWLLKYSHSIPDVMKDRIWRCELIGREIIVPYNSDGFGRTNQLRLVERMTWSDFLNSRDYFRNMKSDQ